MEDLSWVLGGRIEFPVESEDVATVCSPGVSNNNGSHGDDGSKWNCMSWSIVRFLAGTELFKNIAEGHIYSHVLNSMAMMNLEN